MPQSLSPHHFHVTPFFKAPKPLATSGGQPVYALFGANALPVAKTNANLTVFGAAAVGGNAGPMAQASVMGPAGRKQHVYLNAKNQLVELTDAATSTTMLTTYKGSNKSVTEVCQGKRLIGVLTVIARNGTSITQVRHKNGRCRSSVTVAPRDAPAMTSASSAPPSAANVRYDICSLGSDSMPFTANLLTHGKKLDAQLAALGKFYRAFADYLAKQCAGGLALGAAKKPPTCTSGATCAYADPPVPIVAAGPVCPSGGGTVITFNAPGQSCTVKISASSGASFTAKTSDSALVTVSPSSGTVSGSGATLTFTAGAAGGIGHVTFDANGAATVFDVTNDWTSGAPAIGSIAIQLSETILPLGHSLTFSVVAKTKNGNTIAGSYDNPIVLTAKNLDVSSSMLPDAAHSANVSATWNNAFGGAGGGSIVASADGVKSTATVGVPSVIEYPLPHPSSGPWGMATAADGSAWFTECSGGRLGRIASDGTVTEYTTPSGGCNFGITAGPDGALWFDESTANKIGRITTTGSITEYDNTGGGCLDFIISGIDGALWYTQNCSLNIGRITTTGSVTQFPIPDDDTDHWELAFGSDGALWFWEGSVNRIGRMTTTGVVTDFPIPTSNAQVESIVGGPDGALWFTEIGAAKIGRMTTTGAVTEFPIPTGGYPNDMIVGPDGALWFTKNGGPSLDRITTDGSIVEYPIPTANADPEGLTYDGHGSFWFTENISNGIGRLQLPGSYASSGGSRLPHRRRFPTR